MFWHTSHAVCCTNKELAPFQLDTAVQKVEKKYSCGNLCCPIAAKHVTMKAPAH
jgi:hypothetical protein